MATSTKLTRRGWTRRWPWILAAILGLGAAAALYLYFGPMGRLDAATLERVLEPAIASATRGLYGIEIGHVEAGISSRDLVVHDVRIAPRPEAVGRLARDGQLPALRFSLQVDRFEIRGVDRGAVLTGRGLLADRIQVDGPTIRATLDPSPDERGNGAGTEPDIDSRAAAERVAAWVDENLRGVPELRVGTVAIRDGAGALAWIDTPASDSLRVGDVDITFVKLHIHEDAGPEGFRSLFSDDVRLQASDFDLNRGNDSGWLLEGLELSTKEGAVRLHELRFDPGITVPEYLQRTTIAESDRSTLWLGEVAAEGIDFPRLIGHLDLDMDRLAIGGLRLEILHDRHKPSATDDGAPPQMPHDLVRELAGGLNVRTVEISNGYVSYSERHPQAPRPGTIAFEDISVKVDNLSNDSARMTADSPAVWNVESRVYGVAPLSLTVSMPLLAPPPRMRLEGEIGEFEADLLNPILVPLTGTELRGGHVLGVAFDLDYTSQQADGDLRAEYRGLRLSPVDRATGARDLKDVVLGFVASRLAIRDDNVDKPGRPARTATIHYRFDRRDPFFKILWEPLRNGIRDLVER